MIKTLIILAGVAVIATGCVTIQGDTTYAGTYVSNQKDSKAVNVSGSNGNNVYREAEAGKGIAGNEGQAVGDTVNGKGAQVVIAGQDINQNKQAEVDAIASLQAGNKAAGSAGGDGASSQTDGGATDISPNVSATGQGNAEAKSGDKPKPE